MTLEQENALLKQQLEAKDLALRDIAGGNVLPQLIARQVLQRYPSTPTPEGENPAEDAIIRNLREDRNKYREAFEGRISEISTLKKDIADLRIQLEEKNAEIELLRNNGASLRPGTSVLDVLKWAVDHEVVKESGYWRKNYSSIAYTDERIVEEFYKDHPGRTPEQQKAAEKARAIAFASYALGSVSKAFSSLLEVYAQFEIDEAEKIKTGQI